MKVVSTSFVIRVVAGLPNITGEIATHIPTARTTSEPLPPMSGALGDTGGNAWSNYSLSQSSSTFFRSYVPCFSASNSNAIYGSSTIVTPLSMSCIFCISY